MQITVRHAEVMQGAVLIGPTIDPQARTLRKELSRWLAVISRRPYAFPPLVYDYLKAGFKRAWRTLEYTLQDPIEKHLPSVRVPTLVIRGSMDTITPQRWAEEVTNLLPKGQLVVIEGASHDVQDDVPEELSRAIYTFLIDHVPEEEP